MIRRLFQCRLYFLCLFFLWVLFKLVNWKSQPNWVLECADPKFCNVEEIIGSNDNFKNLLSTSLVAPSCIEDKSMFQMGKNSQLIKLHLQSSFWKIARCCYFHFWRIAEEPDFKISKSSRCFPIEENIKTIPIHENFLRVICRDESSSKVIYEDQFANIRVERSYRSEEEPDDFKGIRPDKLSVMIFGMSSMSRIQFLRSYPKTHKFLTSHLKAYEFLGYSPSGQGSVQNIYPLLSGLDYRQFYSSCTDEQYYLNSCPFVWHTFHKNGYHLSFQEDHQEPSLFSLGSRTYRNGFQSSIFNYDLRLLNHKLEHLGLGHKNGSTTKNETSSKNQDQFCYGPRLASKNLIENFELFAHAFKSRSLFHLTWAKTLRQNVEINDRLLETMLMNLKDAQSLNHTVLIFLSDEGNFEGNLKTSARPSSTKILRTPPPLLYIALPDWFKSQYQILNRNLYLNTRKLITTLDLHEFIRDLTNGSQLNDSSLEVEMRRRLKGPRISLALPVHKNRSCAEAGVSELYCACQPRQRVSLENGNAKIWMDALLTGFNEKLRDFPTCAQLKLKEIISVSEVVYDANYTFGKSIIIIFKTTEQVLWEGLVRVKRGLPSFVDVRILHKPEDLNLCITHDESYQNCVCKNKLS